MKYLGNIVSAKGFTPDPEKIRAIIEMLPPESKQDLRRLLGMVNYLSQYIPNMSEITAPLRSRLKKDVQWSWHDEHRKSLERIQQVLTSNPVLANPVQPETLADLLPHNQPLETAESRLDASNSDASNPSENNDTLPAILDDDTVEGSNDKADKASNTDLKNQKINRQVIKRHQKRENET